MKRNLIDASQLELEDKVVSIKRVTKVVKGGRNFRFTALVVVGDGNGHVGAGLGKAAEIPEAIRKGKEDAMKKLVTVARDENNSITHDFIGKFGSAEMLLKRAPEGTGVIAGGPARAVIELAGIKNIRTKCMGSRNKQNVVLATINALSQLKSPEEVARLRGKSVEEICFQDFKVFNVKDTRFGVGQITSMNQDELDEVKERLIPYLEEARKTQGLHMLYLMMTNILEESTELLCCGENAKEQVLEAYELSGDTEKILLKGVVSRKKQMIPVLVTYLQQKQ